MQRKTNRPPGDKYVYYTHPDGKVEEMTKAEAGRSAKKIRRHHSLRGRPGSPYRHTETLSRFTHQHFASQSAGSEPMIAKSKFANRHIKTGTPRTRKRSCSARLL